MEEMAKRKIETVGRSEVDKAELEGVCPCGKKVYLSEETSRGPAVIHELPFCDKFENTFVDEYIHLINWQKARNLISQ